MSSFGGKNVKWYFPFHDYESVCIVLCYESTLLIDSTIHNSAILKNWNQIPRVIDRNDMYNDELDFVTLSWNESMN